MKIIKNMKKYCKTQIRKKWKIWKNRKYGKFCWKY